MQRLTFWKLSRSSFERQLLTRIQSLNRCCFLARSENSNHIPHGTSGSSGTSLSVEEPSRRVAGFYPASPIPPPPPHCPQSLYFAFHDHLVYLTVIYYVCKYPSFPTNINKQKERKRWIKGLVCVGGGVIIGSLRNDDSDGGGDGDGNENNTKQ